MKYERMTDSFKFLLKINYEQPSPLFFFWARSRVSKQEKIDVNTMHRTLVARYSRSRDGPSFHAHPRCLLKSIIFN